MDTTGYYPQLAGNDPLFEIAEYSQIMKQRLDLPPAIILRKATTQSVDAGVWTSINLDTEEYKYGLTHSNTTNASRVTITQSGIYLVQMKIGFNSQYGAASCAIALNGIQQPHTIQNNNNASGTYDKVALSLDMKLMAGDYIDLQGKCSQAALADVPTFFTVRLAFPI